jgi:hypothetical protein
MQILFYALVILSSLLSIVVGASSFIVGLVTEADETWGWMIILGSILYLAHPAVLYWLFKKVHETLAIGLTSLSLVVSSVLIIFL